MQTRPWAGLLTIDVGLVGLLDHILVLLKSSLPPGPLHWVGDVVKAKIILEIIETEIIELVNLWRNSVAGLSQGNEAD